MKAFILRLNTLVIIVVVLGAIGLSSYVTYLDLSKLSSNCPGSQYFREENPVTHAGHFYDRSKNPPTIIPDSEVFTDDQCQTVRNEWKMAIFSGVGIVILVLLLSATISWLFGVGFRIHFQLRT
jgi:hypothetical protein